MAWLLACATFPLIWVGGLVTTTGAGMAFPDWITSDGYFMLFYPWFSSAGDKFVEHGHRLLGVVVGCLAIGLVLVAWISEPRRWVRFYAVVLLAGVIAQGVLGGLRVILDGRVLALIHGCTGPLFFAMCCGMVVVTSRWWNEAPQRSKELQVSKMFRLAVLTTLLAYLQLIVGALVRHTPLMTDPRAGSMFQAAVYFHVVLAVVVTVHIVLLSVSALRNRLHVAGSLALLAFVLIQVLLGVSTWVVKYGMPLWATNLFGEMRFTNTAADFTQSAIITSHVAVGSLILAVSTAIALRLARELRITMQYGTWKSGTGKLGDWKSASSKGVAL